MLVAFHVSEKMTMNSVRILLVTLHSTVDSSRSKRDILEAANRYEFQILDEDVQQGKVAASSERLNAAIELHQPAVVLLCFDSCNKAEVEGLLQILRGSDPAVPVMAAASSASADELFEVIQLGVEDFI